uniref:alkaline phosphatase family protein n=1 Tax=Halothiobacillus sp. TaxID=1891311 RepID=UPI002AD59ED8
MSLLKYTALSAALTLACAPASHAAPVTPIQHVVLISIDGLHAFDLRHFIKTHPHSTLADLARHGVEYSQDFTPAPADSFPGLMALTTGGTPGQTGIYYDVSYDRALSPPG